MKNKLVKSVTENLFKNRGGSGTQGFPSSLALRLWMRRAARDCACCAILIFTLAFRGQASAAETPEDAQSRIDNLEQRIQRMEGLAAELEALKAELAKEKQKSAKDQKPAEAQSPSAPGHRDGEGRRAGAGERGRQRQLTVQRQSASGLQELCTR